MRDGTTIEVNQKKVLKLEQHRTNPSFHTDKRQVFIIGCKGIPAAYGGFETFVDKLTEYQASDRIHYHVARMGKDGLRYEYNGAKCFNVPTPNIGPVKAIYYDIATLKRCIDYCKARPSIKRPIFYVLACRIGPFIRYFKKKIQNLGGVLCVNPDGHEWKRQKWSAPVRKYWKVSEKLMVKYADLLICDSKKIEKYIQADYKKYHPITTFISYGSEITLSRLSDDNEEYTQWLQNNNLKPKEYYLIVGRFVPENNFETMIKEFMQSDTKRDLAIITTTNEKLLDKLEQKLHVKQDHRVKFVGTVYNQELLKKIRENAFAYFHGHEVGGTNPSLLEALGSTDMNLLLKVGFNEEVAQDAALYWTKETGNLSKLIYEVEHLNNIEISEFGKKAKNRIASGYSWDYIVKQYEKLFLNS